MRTLLVPTDFSSHSTQAAFFALSLARDLDAEVHLLHINRMPVPPLAMPAYGVTTPILSMEPAIREMRHEANSCMKELLPDLDKEAAKVGYKGPIRQTILEGEPVEEICKWIDQFQPIAMVLGVTTRSSLYRLFIGSVAGRLLQEVEIPVFAIPSGAQYRSFDKAVFASDFDPDDQPSLVKMNQLLRESVKDWHVVHVTDDLEEQYLYDRQGEVAEKMKARFASAGIQARIHAEILTEGTMLEAVEGYAREHEASLVAFVMHKRNAFARLIDPSVSSEALFHLHLPMLFLHTSATVGAIW